MLFLNRDSSCLNVFEWKDESFGSLPLQEFKYKRWDWAYENVPDQVKPLLERMFDLMPLDEDMRWLVDFKVRDLKAGDCGCKIEGWHLDVVSNPNHKSKPDFHLLYTTEFGTEFLTTHMIVDPSDTHFNHAIDCFNLGAVERYKTSAKPNHVSAYNRFQLHRAPIVPQDCRRMLLRVTATEVIR
ncbi:hypothetical protein D3C84_731210 [compost metagenome]